MNIKYPIQSAKRSILIPNRKEGNTHNAREAGIRRRAKQASLQIQLMGGSLRHHDRAQMGPLRDN